jgi:hypothetical protein
MKSKVILYTPYLNDSNIEMILTIVPHGIGPTAFQKLAGVVDAI